MRYVLFYKKSRGLLIQFVYYGVRNSEMALY